MAGNRIAKILYVTHRRDLTGPEFSLMHLIHYLDRERFEPLVACQGKGPFYDSLRRLGVETFLVPMPLVKAPPGAARKALWLAQTLPPFILATLRLASIIVRKKVDLVHTNVSVNLCGAAAARLTGRKSVIHLREIYKEQTNRKLYHRAMKTLSNRLVAVSEAVKSQWLDSQIEVVYNGVPLVEFQNRDGYRKRIELGLGRQDFAVGVFGRLHPQKGHSFFLASALPLFEQFPHFKIVIVGEASDGAEAWLSDLKKWLFREGSSPRVIFTGFRRDVADLMSAMDAVAIPSSEPDSLPRVAIEAMAAGKPVVGSLTGGIPEMVVDGETGFVALPGDESAWVEALNRLLEDRALAELLGEQGRARAERFFGIETHVEQVQSIYDELQGRRHHSEL